MTFADTLGTSGRIRDPLWRVEFTLSALERELLRSWPVRRLGFIAHAGAAAMVSTQSYSRLEHSLGLLALVVHFSPDDWYGRAAALLHDVGHLPFSHTFEGVAGLDHHELGIQRTTELAPLLRRHGLDSELLVEIMAGTRSSVLQGDQDGLRLDHLDSFVRSGRAHGRTHEPPPITLSQLRLSNGVVDTDTDTADYLIELIEAEARWQSSEPNVVATAVVRNLAERLLEDHATHQSEDRSAELAAMTDDEFWALLLADPRTVAVAATLRRDPAGWHLVPDGPAEAGQPDDISFVVSRRYLGRPLVDGRPMPSQVTLADDLPGLPWRVRIRRQME